MSWTAWRTDATGFPSFSLMRNCSALTVKCTANHLRMFCQTIRAKFQQSRQTMICLQDKTPSRSQRSRSHQRRWREMPPQSSYISLLLLQDTRCGKGCYSLQMGGNLTVPSGQPSGTVRICPDFGVEIRGHLIHPLQIRWIGQMGVPASRRQRNKPKDAIYWILSFSFAINKASSGS